MSDKAQKEKEKGNAAFKNGNYPTAIGHYTAAILADRNDPTYPLNRAAAYLKLGKHEDAERDCDTVLRLSSKNVKAYFRRGQARVGLGKFIEAQRDFTEALRLEPDNQPTKEELRKIAELIELEKRKKTQPRHIDVTFDSSLHPTPVPKRRRIPIRIVEPQTSAQLLAKEMEEPQPVSQQKDAETHSSPTGEINLVSSRTIKSSLDISVTKASESRTSISPSISERTPPPASQSASRLASTLPSKTSFGEAERARESLKTSHVGGGIFRASGRSTVFPTRNDPSEPAKERDEIAGLNKKDNLRPGPPKEPPQSEQQGTKPDEKPSASNNGISLKPPATLFELNRLWRLMPTTEDKWKLIQTISPSDMPSFCKTSLEPALLVSILETFRTVLESDKTLENLQKVRMYMDNLAKVSRFSTLVMLLSPREKEIAKGVWRKLEISKAPGPWASIGNLDV